MKTKEIPDGNDWLQSLTGDEPKKLIRDTNPSEAFRKMRRSRNECLLYVGAFLFCAAIVIIATLISHYHHNHYPH